MKSCISHGETLAEQWLAHREDSEGVLSGLKFVLQQPHPKMPDKVLADVIVAQGGEVIAAKTCSPGSDPSVIVIAQAKRTVTDFAEAGHPVYTYEFLFQGIMTQKLEFTKNNLTTPIEDPRQSKGSTKKGTPGCGGKRKR